MGQAHHEDMEAGTQVARICTVLCSPARGRYAGGGSVVGWVLYLSLILFLFIAYRHLRTYAPCLNRIARGRGRELEWRQAGASSNSSMHEYGACVQIESKGSLDPKHAGARAGGGPRTHAPPPANDAPPLATPTQVKISFIAPQKRVLLVTSFQAHMRSLGAINDPTMMSRA